MMINQWPRRYSIETLYQWVFFFGFLIVMIGIPILIVVVTLHIHVWVPNEDPVRDGRIHLPSVYATDKLWFMVLGDWLLTVHNVNR